jgi:hypothetical protein
MELIHSPALRPYANVSGLIKTAPRFVTYRASGRHFSKAISICVADCASGRNPISKASPVYLVGGG